MDDTTSDARIEQDGQGVITDWNFAAERLFGWTLAQARGMQSYTIIPPRNRERHDRALQAILNGDRRVHSSRISVLHRDGHEFTVDLATSLQDRDQWFIRNSALEASAQSSCFTPASAERVAR